MSILKPVLIAILVILTVLIIWKANKFVTSGQPNEEEPEEKKPQAEPRPARSEPMPPIEFFVVYMGRRVPVTHYPFTIGSRSDNDLIVSDATVSRQHAEMLRKNGQVVLRDLGSLNGTFVNKATCSETVIHGGETVQIGKTILQIERAVDEISDETTFIRR